MTTIISVPGPQAKTLSSLRYDHVAPLPGLEAPPVLSVSSLIGRTASVSATPGFAAYQFIWGDGSITTQVSNNATHLYPTDAAVSRIAYVRGKDSAFGIFGKVSGPLTITF